MNTSSLKIGIRLTLGFAIVLALSVVMGLVSINKLSEVNDATAELATTWIVGTRTLGTYSGIVNDMRRAEASHIMSSSDEQYTLAEKRIVDDKEKAAKALKDYAETVSPGEKQILYASIQSAEEHYYATQPGLLKISRAHEGVTDALREVYNGPSRNAFKELMTAIDANIQYHTKGADAAYHASQSQYAATRTKVFALLIASIAIGSLLAWVITGSIASPVNEALALAEAIATGDLTRRIHSTNKDELGQLLRAMSGMTENLSKVVANVRSGSEGVATASSEIAQGNHDLSSRTESQASALEETAASMEQLSATENKTQTTHAKPISCRKVRRQSPSRAAMWSTRSSRP